MNGSMLEQQLKRQEGVSLKPYKCTGDKLTIGYGRNLEDRGITAVEAQMMLQTDIAYLFSVLPKRIKCFNYLEKARADVLVNMAFNLGVNGLLKFEKMLVAVEAGDYCTAAKEMLDSKWAKQVKGRAEELAKQMESGEYKIWP